MFQFIQLPLYATFNQKQPMICADDNKTYRKCEGLKRDCKSEPFKQVHHGECGIHCWILNYFIEADEKKIFRRKSITYSFVRVFVQVCPRWNKRGMLLDIMIYNPLLWSTFNHLVLFLNWVKNVRFRLCKIFAKKYKIKNNDKSASLIE